MIVVVSALALSVAHRAPEERFCLTGGAMFHRDGTEVWLQDQGSPGDDGCDDSEVRGWGATKTLGYDCNVRASNGDELETLEPNRADGTCGLPDPPDTGYPTAWTTS